MQVDEALIRSVVAQVLAEVGKIPPVSSGGGRYVGRHGVFTCAKEAIAAASDAYEQLGDLSKAASHLVRLADLVVAQKDHRLAASTLKKLSPLGSTPEILKARGDLEALLKSEPVQTAPAAPAPSPRRTMDVTREVSLAWDLLQAKEISQEDYSAVVHDLTENSMKMLDVPVSVLHALHDRNFKNIERVIAYLSKASGKPFVALAFFDIPKDTFKTLPLDMAARRGALVFEVMGTDALVAILNPYDQELQEDVKRATGKRCHFFLVSSVDFDTALANYRKTLAPAA
jgi:hypothetical protein